MHPLLLSLIVSVIAVPLVIKLGIADRPNHRSIHAKVTPKAGGIGMLCGILAGLWVQGSATLVIAVLVAVAALLGLVDDLKELNPKVKLAGQALLAVGTVLAGFHFNLLGILPDYLLTIAFIMLLMNAFNLIDGMDGLAAGAALISFIIFSLLPGLTLLIPAVTGSLLGFLVFNFKPAKIFMGDTGSMMLGFVLALTAIDLQTKTISPLTGLLVGVLILAYPIIDTCLSIVRRKVNHKPVFAPDRSHSYNLLVDKLGLSYLATVFTIYGIVLILGALGLIVYWVPIPAAALIIPVVLLMIIVTAVYKFGLLHESRFERPAKKANLRRQKVK